MPSLDFPSNPVDGQTYSASGVNYVYNSGIGAWLTSYVSTPLATSSNTQVLFNDSGASNGSFGLTFDRRANTLTSNTVIVNSNLGIGPISDFSSTGKNAKLAIDTGGINIDDGYFVAWGGGTGRTSITGNKANGTMVLAATGNSSGYMGFSVNNSERMRIEANGSVGITGNVSVASGTTNTSITVTSAGGGAQVTMSSFGGTLGILGSTNNIPVDLMTNGVSRMRIDTSGRITTPFQPAFTAYGGSVVSVSISNYVLALTATMTNRGSHYNTSNFRFTAPVAGTYLFAHRITFASTGTGVVVYLAVNGGPAGGSSSITEVFGYNVTNMGTTYHTTSASISVVTLNVNDFVDLRTVIYNASPQSLDLSRCSLTGYLLG